MGASGPMGCVPGVCRKTLVEAPLPEKARVAYESHPSRLGHCYVGPPSTAPRHSNRLPSLAAKLRGYVRNPTLNVWCGHGTKADSLDPAWPTSAPPASLFPRPPVTVATDSYTASSTVNVNMDSAL